MNTMKNEQFISTAELAKLMGISRIAVFKKIQKGQIEATKVGRAYIIDKSTLGFGNDILSDANKKEIEKAVKRVIRDYGQTLKLLGKN